MSTSTAAPEPGLARGPARWLISLAGLLSIAAGVIVLFKPGGSLVTLTVIAGVFVLVDAIVEVGAALLGRTENRALTAMLGVLGALAGVLLIRHPVAGIVWAALLIGAWLLIGGITRMIVAFDATEHRAWQALVGAVQLIAGIVIVASPGIGFATLALFVGISFVMNGLAMFALGWAMHEVDERTAAPPREAGAASA